MPENYFQHIYLSGLIDNNTQKKTRLVLLLPGFSQVSFEGLI